MTTATSSDATTALTLVAMTQEEVQVFKQAQMYGAIAPATKKTSKRKSAADHGQDFIKWTDDQCLALASAVMNAKAHHTTKGKTSVSKKTS